MNKINKLFAVIDTIVDNYFTDTGLAPATSYTYRVRGVLNGIYTDYTGELIVVTNN